MDRQQWRLLYSGPAPFSLADVTLELRITNNDAGLNPDAVRWDDFNTP